jgi:hypothetical protein
MKQHEPRVACDALYYDAALNFCPRVIHAKICRVCVRIFSIASILNYPQQTPMGLPSQGLMHFSAHLKKRIL